MSEKVKLPSTKAPWHTVLPQFKHYILAWCYWCVRTQTQGVEEAFLFVSCLFVFVLFSWAFVCVFILVTKKPSKPRAGADTQ